MTLQQYEEKFLDELIDNWPGINWDEYVKSYYREYMHNKDEQKISEWESSR